MARDTDSEEKATQTGPLDFHEALADQGPADAENIVGTSGQAGAGRAALPQGDSDDRATIDDDDVATPIVPMRMDPSAADEDSVAGHVNREKHGSDAVAGRG